MKQLLTWCGTRALEDNPLHASDEDSGTLAGELALCIPAKNLLLKAAANVH